MSALLALGIVTALVMVAGLGFDTLSSARAYVGGEGLWSKAQKDAVYHLTRYVYGGDPAEFGAFEGNLTVYRGDRQARLELLSPRPDLSRVREGFLAGRNHPDDVNGMARFLRRFHRVPFVAEAVRIWGTGDSLMLALEGIGTGVHQRIEAGALDRVERDAVVEQIEVLALRLTELENAFSQTMGAGARWAARVLLIVLVGTAVLLLGIGAVVLHRANARLGASEASLVALEGQLRQAQKMEAVGQLTGGIAHDFNNLLTVILSTARLMEDAIPPSSVDAREDLADLKAAAQRGAEMIRKLLAFSRAGQLSFEPHALDRVLAEALQMLRRVLPASVQIEAEIDPTTPPVRTDPGAVEQMVLNLATNARDAMPEGGTLHLRLGAMYIDQAFVGRRGWGRVGDYAALTVSDTGSGMDSEVLTRLFEPFFTTKPPGQGSGLGMSMVYGLMKQHGGFVDVASTPGAGTSVTLYFPAAAETPTADRPAPVRVARGNGGNILLVEDEPELRRAAQRLLESQGYRVLVAADGEQGLAMARAHHEELDLVVSDVVMPRMGGPALYVALARERINLPFLFTSGYTAREVRDRTPLPAGVTVLHKPWDVEELTAAVCDLTRVARRPPATDTASSPPIS